jgi:hypothetical protein
MKFQKGRPKTGGRQKGSMGKSAVELRRMIRIALKDVGGVEYLKQQAEDNPVAFMTLIGKIIPKEVGATMKNGITVVVAPELEEKRPGGQLG